MKEERKSLLFGVGGVGAALASALCCAGPLLAVAAGVSSAGLAATFDPLRPWFLGAAAVFLLLGFWTVDREERKACEPGRPCAEPRVRRRMKIMLWVATVIAVLFATFPSWQGLVFDQPSERTAASAAASDASEAPYRTITLDVTGMT